MGSPKCLSKRAGGQILWLIPGPVCIWSVRETLTLLSWRPEDIKESDDGDDGQRRGANRKEATVHVKELELIRQSYAS